MADGQTPNVAGMVADPDFQGLSPADKRAALGKLTGDSSFSGLSDAETMQFISKFPQPMQAGSYQQKKGGPVFNTQTDPQLVDAQGGWTGNYLQKRPGESDSQFLARVQTQAPKVTPQAIQQEKQYSANVAPIALAAADAPGLAAGALSKLPQITRAAAGFADVAGAVGSHTIDVAKAGDVALKTKQLAESGGRMPKVINDFLRRATDPDKAAITYNEARDFYTNATKLSADEFNRLNPVMRRQVTQFTQELGNALSETAARGGKAEALKGAMSEYSNAMKMRSAAKTAGKAALTGAGAYGGYEMLKNLLPKLVP